MTEVPQWHDVPFAELDNVERVARYLVDLAGDDHARLVQTTGKGFRLDYAWADENGLIDGVDLPEIVADTAPADTGEELFDPNLANVPDVIKHLESADFDEQTRVLALELGGQNRVTIARWRPSTEPDTETPATPVTE